VSTSSTTSSSDVILLEGDDLAANYGQNWKVIDRVQLIEHMIDEVMNSAVLDV
jgi:hypothetical protein